MEDEAQLAYVLGHELSHVICQHGKDFCFLETVREAGLLATGFELVTNDEFRILNKRTSCAERCEIGRFI